MAEDERGGVSLVPTVTVLVLAAVAFAGAGCGRGDQRSDGPTAAGGLQWNLVEHIDPMTDQRVLRASIASESGGQALSLQCEGDSADDLFIAVRDPGAMYLPNPLGPDRLTYRFDSETPVQVDAIVNGEYLFIDRLSDRLAFLTRLTEPADRLLLRYETTSGRLSDYAFPLPATQRPVISTASLCSIDRSITSTAGE